MIVFIIPVKSQQISASWDHFSKLFERTLKSVSNQTNPNFKIIVVCHENPTTLFKHPNLEYIHVDFEPPHLAKTEKTLHNGLKREDKSRKVKAGICHSEQYYPDYLMVVDADDCISNKIAAFVESQKDKGTPGWYAKKGFIYREGDWFAFLNKENFNTLCGTCIIVKPKYISNIFQQVPYLNFVHKSIHLTTGVALEPLPFPAAIYSMANGENHFMSNEKIKELNRGSIFNINTLKGLFRKLGKYSPKPLSKSIKEEFGVYNIIKSTLK